jgi:hypothetical protein
MLHMKGKIKKAKQISVNLTRSLFVKPSFGHNGTDTILLYDVSDGRPLDASSEGRYYLPTKYKLRRLHPPHHGGGMLLRKRANG